MNKRLAVSHAEKQGRENWCTYKLSLNYEQISEEEEEKEK